MRVQEKLYEGEYMSLFTNIISFAYYIQITYFWPKFYSIFLNTSSIYTSKNMATFEKIVLITQPNS